ncbi:MAG: FHA domain-containing protein [bacterium]|nr:FHA domain-containing protein [bacterium]
MSDKDELAFVRCPSCNSLIPSRAKRCRMCGFLLSDAAPVENEDPERKSGRVYQKTVSLTPQEVETLKAGIESSDDVPQPVRTSETKLPVEPSSGTPVSEQVTEEKRGGFRLAGRSIDTVIDAVEVKPPQDSKVESGKDREGAKEPAPLKRSERQGVAGPAQRGDEPIVEDRQGAEHLETGDSEVRQQDDGRSQFERERRERAKERKRKKNRDRQRQSYDESAVVEKESVVEEVQARKPNVFSDAVSKERKEEFHPKQKFPREVRVDAEKTHEMSSDGELVGWLVSYERDSRGIATELRTGRFMVTQERLRSTDMLINHSSVSTPHCMLKAVAGRGIEIGDLMSENGTYVKKAGEQSYTRHSDPVVVTSGDSVKFGSYEVLICLVPSRRK